MKKYYAEVNDGKAVILTPKFDSRLELLNYFVANEAWFEGKIVTFYNIVSNEDGSQRLYKGL